MSRPGPRRAAIVWRWGLVLAGAAALTWVCWILQRPLDPDPEQARETFRSRVADAAATARSAVERDVGEAFELGRRQWGEHLEGLGLTDERGFLRWAGAPAEPDAALPTPGTTWELTRQGRRFRLQVRYRSGEAAEYGVATFVWDDEPRFPGGPFLPEFPAARLASLSADDDATERLRLLLEAPSGETLGTLSWEPVVAGGPQRTLARLAFPFLSTLGALIALGLPWRRACRSGWGLAAVVAAIIAGRLLLAALHPLAGFGGRLHSADLYGSAVGGGLYASPLDYALTGAALLWIALALRHYGVALAPRRPRAAVFAVGIGAAAMVVVALASARSLAQDGAASLRLLEGFSPLHVHTALLFGLSAPLIAAALLLAVIVPLALAAERSRPRRMRERLTAILILLPLSVAAIAVFHTAVDAERRERLESEYAPQVADQSARRRLALDGSLARAATSPITARALAVPAGPESKYAAYRLWLGSQLYRMGYHSSLQIHDAAGTLVSHFGHDLPLLDEEVPGETAAVEPTIVEEIFETPWVRKPAYHGEMSLRVGERFVGTLVAHVLDDPENLPFLPTAAPYLSALGGEDPNQGGRLPDYLLYENGEVLLSTLRQPPAPRDEWGHLAAAGRFVEVSAAGSEYDALPLADGSRLHLLLQRQRPILDRLAVTSKLFLLTVVLFGAIELLRAIGRHGGVGFVPAAIRESFYARLLATLLVATLLPLILLAVVIQGYVESRGEVQLADAAGQVVGVVEEVIRDFAASDADAGQPLELSDTVLFWLRGIVDQEIHVYENDLLLASSKRELFSSGLLNPRLPGAVHRQAVVERQPFVLTHTRLGGAEIPVAYTRIPVGDGREWVAAVPLLIQKKEAERAVERIEEMLLLSTVVVASLLILAASFVATTVARPVRQLVEATGRIADGDYSARLTPSTEDEIAALVRQFNVMASALARQRADLVRRTDYVEALLAHATTGVLSVDADGRLVTINPAVRQLLKLGADELPVGASLAEALAGRGELAPLLEALDRAASRSGQDFEVDLTDEQSTVRLRGVSIHLPDPDAAATGRLVLIDDVTDLMRSNQLAAWAEMARAIAHEIKNPLTPIQLSSEHLERILRDGGVEISGSVAACLDTIKNQVRSLREIAAEFSTYARLPDLAPEPIEPALLLERVLRPYRSALPEGVELAVDCSAKSRILVDAKVVSRALINLIENALHAMPGGGTLTVGCGELDGAEVWLGVGDTGIGLEPEVRARLFEPYFSTKSSGTGLGLAIVRRAVEAHGGRIEVDSVPSSGTRFRLVFPAEASGD